MRKPNNANKFVSKFNKRAKKLEALRSQNTPEARKEIKRMNIIRMGKLVSTNVKGMYGRTKPVKIKITAKTRHTTRPAKAIMSGRA